MRRYENVKISKLKPYEKNARTHSDEQVEKIARSIEEFGFINPVLIDSNYGIIAGHGRVLGAKKLGMEEVPCLFVEDLTEEQKRAYIIADNKLALDAGWDEELLQQELIDLDALGFDTTLTGFDLDEFDFGEAITVEEDDYDVDKVPENPTSKSGDIYQLGNHRLMCGDSTNAEDVAKLMNGDLADMCVTDPPYNVDYEAKAQYVNGTTGVTEDRHIANDCMDEETFANFLDSAFRNLSQNLKRGGSYYVWHSDMHCVAFMQALENNELTPREKIIWNKNCMVLGRQDYNWKHEPCIYGWKDGGAHYFINDRTKTTVIDCDKPRISVEHPTMKPLPLFAECVKNSSKPKDKVLDLFGGSGTTLIVCENLDRQCYMMEYDPKYVDVIINRWETLTGKKAVKIEGE